MSSELPIPYSVKRDKLVHIVDADLHTCESLSVLLRLEGFQTAFSTGTGEFLASSTTRSPDLVLLNFAIDEGSGLSLLKQCRTKFQGMPVVMLADAPNMIAAVEAMKLGARDVVAKPLDSEWLMTLIREAFRRDLHVVVAPDGSTSVEIVGFKQLTPRERQVLQTLANGMSNKESAKALGISFRTVEIHRARVMEKLRAKNTADLMRIALTS